MKNAKAIILCFGLMSAIGVKAQQEGLTGFYEELPNPAKKTQVFQKNNEADWKNCTGVFSGWGSTDIRYKKELPPTNGKLNKDIVLTAWKGERVSSQFLVWGNQPLQQLSFKVSDLIHSNGKDKIGQQRFLKGFVRYVMTDELNKDGNGGCGYRPNAAAYDSSLVADPIDHLTKELSLPARTTQGGWLRVWVPQDVPAGIYSGTVSILNGNKVLNTLTIKVNVKDQTLPSVDDWNFRLDLWQNPFAIARYHGVELWSKEHFEAMKPYMELYHQAGGAVITASIMHKPWNGQTYDYFESMVTWMKKADGTWHFDYTVFDKWVEFMMKLGIKKEINCYSMVPWKLSFQYFDQASNQMKFLNMEPGSKQYDEVWTTMLKSFADHLKKKGWFGITHIAMDERPMDVMKKTIAVIHKADPDFKISLAGNLYEELSPVLNDYCVALSMKYPEKMLQQRKKEGKITTYYTCCTEARPNTFTFSPPAEAAWLGWYAAKENLDGYLRWALNSWVKDPLRDSRFSAWAAGDTYLIYPGGRTSIRFERLVEGIQAYEKIHILRNKYKNNPAVLKKIQKALNTFDESTLKKTPAAGVVEKANKVINSL